jgi:hypothetical protein
MDALVTAARIVVDLLVRGEYEAVERLSGGRRLSAPEMRAAVEGYGRHLVMPPDAEWRQLDAVRISGSEPPSHHVVVPLWTAEEGRSDLSLELRLTESQPGVYETEVLDIHSL